RTPRGPRHSRGARRRRHGPAGRSWGYDRDRRLPCPYGLINSANLTREDAMAPGLPRRTLGRTGIAVPALGFGSAPLGDIYSVLDDAAAIGAVRTAFESGVALFDTAPHYGHGLAEHRIGTALRGVPREKFVLSTKVGRRMEPRLPRIGESRFV